MSNNETSPGKTYFANYSRRIQAALLDGIILVVMLVILIVLVSNSELSQWVKVSLFVFVGLLFEPLMVSMTGASLGHHYKGLRVEKDGQGRNLNILEALFRFLIKSVLGTFSLVFFLITKRHKALHDMAVNSVVMLNQASIKKGIGGVSERIIEEDGFKNASKLRRAVMICLYTFLLLILTGLLSYSLTTINCFNYNRCSALENTIESLIGLVFTGLFLTTVYFGWHSRLLGCRRSKIENEHA